MDLSSQVGSLHGSLQGHLQLDVFGGGSGSRVLRHEVVVLLGRDHVVFPVLLRDVLVLLVDRAAAHLRSELLFSRGHLPLTAPTHHASWLLALDMLVSLAAILAIGLLRIGSGASVGADNSHGQRLLLQRFNDIICVVLVCLAR